LTEAQEQQTAAAEILHVISRSQADLQPVFDTIAQSAVRLCAGIQGNVVRFDGELVHRVAGFNLDQESEEAFRHYFPRAPGRELALTRAILDGSVVHVPDTLQDTDRTRELAQTTRARALLAVPMLRDGKPIGAISVARREARPFSDSQIALLQTFADQAVIAIENVRLFKELETRNGDLTEALERETATSAILRVISSSPTDVQPVFEAIVRNAVRLCDGLFGSVYRYDGERIHSVAHYNFTPEQLEHYRRTWPRVLSDPGDPVTVIRTGSVLRIRNMEIHPGFLASPPDVKENLRWRGVRSAIGVPMLRQDQVIGAIFVSHHGVDAFTDAHVGLLQTFADQAVIAIENVRLFKELEARNRDLTQALEQQTATSEILQTIAHAQTDVQPALDMMAESAARLCGAYDASVVRLDGEVLRRVAHHGPIPAGFVISACERGTVTGRAMIDREPIHVADLQAETVEFPEGSRFACQSGTRTLLSVPLVREGVAIGAINIRRTEVQPFNDSEIALLQTFADQAVIAIENVRLFTELQEKNQALTEAHAQVTEALDQQTATGRILGAISSSPTDVQPVFDAIVDSAVRLCDGLFGAVLRFDGELLHLVAHHNLPPAALASYERIFPLPPSRGMVAGRAVLDCAVASLPDIEADPDLNTASTMLPALRYGRFSHSPSSPMGRTPRPSAIERRSILPTPTPIRECPKLSARSLKSVVSAAGWRSRCFVATRRSGRSA
jgi:two-component system, NtrC family, sensor kinase